jgi:hypothetical protein
LTTIRDIAIMMNSRTRPIVTVWLQLLNAVCFTNDVTGVPTGYRPGPHSGFQAGDLIILAALAGRRWENGAGHQYCRARGCTRPPVAVFFDGDGRLPAGGAYRWLDYFALTKTTCAPAR